MFFLQMLTINFMNQFSIYRQPVRNRSPHMVSDMCILTWVYANPEQYQSQKKLLCVTSKVGHHITATGSTVFSKARQLAHDELRLTKNEFHHMIDLESFGYQIVHGHLYCKWSLKKIAMTGVQMATANDCTRKLLSIFNHCFTFMTWWLLRKVRMFFFKNRFS